MEKGGTKNLIKKVVLCGNFAKDNLSVVNGQVTKTRNLFSLLQKKFVKVKRLDTSKNRIALFCSIVFSYLFCDAFCLCVARNGTKRLVPLLNFLKKVKKKTRVYFFCVGTCPLPSDYYPNMVLSEKQIAIKKYLKNFNAICPETKVLKKALENVFGLNNVIVFKNYQIEKRIVESKNVQHNGKYVFYSRISNEKNIHYLIDCAFRLAIKKDIKIDFYGPIEKDVESDFLSFVNASKNFQYLGIIDSSKSIDVLSKYKALIFTTKCLEGTPGAIIDAFFANVPVVSQHFWACQELIVDPNTGIVDSDIFRGILSFESINQNQLKLYKKNCFDFATTYNEITALKNITILFSN